MTSILLFLCSCAALICLCRSTFDSGSQLQLKVLQRISEFDREEIPISRRSLSIYYVANPSSEDHVSVLENNMKIFSGAVRMHSHSAAHQAFYVYCVAGGDENPLSRHLPTDSNNTAFISLSVSHGDLAAHVHMVALLGDNIISKFHSVLFLNQDARGPFIDRANGGWWEAFISKLNEKPNMALVGPMISCEIAPHVQTHTFIMRSDAATDILSEFNPRTAAGKRNKAKQLETSLSVEALNAGYAMSSIYYHKYFNLTEFDGQCFSRNGNALYTLNPTSWCGVQPRDAIFMKWGGQPLHIREFLCQDTVDAVKNATSLIAEQESGLGLVLPELQELLAYVHDPRDRSVKHELHREQAHEMRDRSVKQELHREYAQEARERSVKKYTLEDLQDPVEDSKVCLIVRTSTVHSKAVLNNSRQVPTGLNTLMESLLRQSNPNWEAYFVITDDQPFDEELQAILRENGDARLQFVDIDKQFRPKFTSRGAGYEATDAALRIVQKNAQCKWLSCTNADNIYGSEVVHNVLNSPLTSGSKQPDAVLIPLDSRNYEDFLRKRASMGEANTWDLKCTFLETEFARTRYGYAMTPFPTLGGLDLASLFMDRKKFVQTGVYFSDFSEPSTRFPCEGCQDGYFMDEIRVNRNWAYHRVEMTNFKSLIFHGPSPLWCIAAGNVWFDHPQKTVCLSHKTVGNLFPNEWYDWKSFYKPHTRRVCLRLSEAGFGNSSAAAVV